MDRWLLGGRHLTPSGPRGPLDGSAPLLPGPGHSIGEPMRQALLCQVHIVSVAVGLACRELAQDRAVESLRRRAASIYVIPIAMSWGEDRTMDMGRLAVESRA